MHGIICSLIERVKTSRGVWSFKRCIFGSSALICPIIIIVMSCIANAKNSGQYRDRVPIANLVFMFFTLFWQCVNRNMGKSHRYREEIMSKKWGMLTPIKFHGNSKTSKRTLWLCRCDCGNEVIVRSDTLRSNRQHSCGCLLKRKGSQHPSWRGHKEISGYVWRKILKDAERRNLEFKISIEQCWKLFLKQKRKCALSGLNLRFPTHRQDYDQSASLDRIDSSKGYFINNIQWVDKRINMMKQSFSQEEFITLCKNVAKNF